MALTADFFIIELSYQNLVHNSTQVAQLLTWYCGLSYHLGIF